MVAVGCHLGQVGDCDDLNGACDVGHHFADHVGDVTAHARIHLVKDDARQLDVASNDGLNA